MKKSTLKRMKTTQLIGDMKFNKFAKELEDLVVKSFEIALSDRRLSDKTIRCISERFIKNMVEETKKLKEEY